MRLKKAELAHVAALHRLRRHGNRGNASDSAKACEYAVQELRMLPNVGQLACSCSGSSCTAGPIAVQARLLSGVSGVPFGADGTPATEVAVTYQSPQLFPLPGMMGRMTITRVVQMKVI